VPINRTTINGLYGLSLNSDDAVERFLAARAEPRERIENSEDAVVAKVGRDLYERFFRGYTRKQWGLDPTQLHASVCARIPVRFNIDDRYFTDSFQKVPAEGYTAMVARMLDHENITVLTGVDFEDVRDSVAWRHLIWTGTIDAFFGHRLGHLPYRSLRFELETHPTPGGDLLQPVAQVNFPSEDVAYTRVTEFRHITGQAHDVSTIAYEYPTAEGDPYYPVPRPENRERYARYQKLAAQRDDVTFVGRLARYQYLNMDQVVAGALAEYSRRFEALEVAA
jgi:UDP-galactopyranose mutase